MKTDVANLLLAQYGKKNPPEVKPGDTVKVHQKIKEGEKERVQIFEGLVIAVKHGKGLNASFTVRKIAAGGIGVERTYPLHSPNVLKVERTKSAEVNRAKLYYMRDRLGKAARFKNEERTPMAWAEPDAPKDLPIEEPTLEQIDEVLEEEVVASPEAENEVAEIVAEAAVEGADEAVVESDALPEEVTETEVKAEEPVIKPEEPAQEEVK